MGFKQWAGNLVGQSGIFHRNRGDNPVPTGEQNPLPTTRVARVVQAVIPVGQGLSNPVEIGGATVFGLVFPGGRQGGTSSAQLLVAQNEEGPYWPLSFSASGGQSPVTVCITKEPGATSLGGLSAELMPWAFLKFDIGQPYAGDPRDTAAVIEVHMK